MLCRGTITMPTGLDHDTTRDIYRVIDPEGVISDTPLLGQSTTQRTWLTGPMAVRQFKKKTDTK